MTEPKSLKQKVNEVSVYSFLCMAVVMFTCFLMYSIKKTKVTEEKIQSDLTANLKNQTNLFLPSFLLPEQRLGMDLILSRIRSDEGLEAIKIIKDQKDVPPGYDDCRLNSNSLVACHSNDLSKTAIVAPLIEMNKIYGFIFKSKQNSSAAGLVGILQFAGYTLLIIALAFAVVYFHFTKLIAKTLPDSMNELLKWIESELEGQHVEDVHFSIKELEELKLKIGEVIDRANKSRDQAVVGQVTSGIMHDIKTPLQSIVTAVHLVGEQEAGSVKRMKRLENLYAMCANNIPMIGDIIETTLDGNRNIQISKAKSNLRETVDASLRITRELSRLRNVNIEVDVPDELIAHYDSLQFMRVVNNLLKNGIEAASESTEVPAKVKITSSEDIGEVRLIFEDSGVGFKGSPAKVFRAFRTTKVRGTGLGLLISKKIVEAHNGRIIASNGSVLGGARMEVVLPSHEERV